MSSLVSLASRLLAISSANASACSVLEIPPVNSQEIRQATHVNSVHEKGHIRRLLHAFCDAQALVEEQARLVRVAEQQRQMEERQKLQQQLFQVSLAPALKQKAQYGGRRCACRQLACIPSEERSFAAMKQSWHGAKIPPREDIATKHSACQVK